MEKKDFVSSRLEIDIGGSKPYKTESHFVRMKGMWKP